MAGDSGDFITELVMPHESRSGHPQPEMPSGSLYSLSGYIEWRLGDETIRLDGDFTVSELRAMADYMEAHTPNKDDDAIL